jgi:predicted transcriptional regulator
MKLLTIQISEETLQQLQQLAQAEGTSPEELLQSRINHWLSPTQPDFTQAVNYVLQKNAELYQRLA